jgi:hypothetical protein
MSQVFENQPVAAQGSKSARNLTVLADFGLHN